MVGVHVPFWHASFALQAVAPEQSAAAPQ